MTVQAECRPEASCSARLACGAVLVLVGHDGRCALLAEVWPQCDVVVNNAGKPMPGTVLNREARTAAFVADTPLRRSGNPD